jgi:hypothetical protein
LPARSAASTSRRPAGGFGLGLLDARQQQGHRGAPGLAAADAHAARLLGEAIHHRHPRPLPMPNCLVVKKGSKTRARVLPSMPMPLSVTAICT